MGNVQESISKKKRINHIICYFGLVILVILLFLPGIFKIFFKDSGEQKKEDVVVTLKCNKGSENINSSFLNNEPQYIMYSFQGKYEVTENDEEKSETEQNNSNSQVNENNQTINNNQNTESSNINVSETLLKRFLNYSTISYSEADNTSSIRVQVSLTRGSSDYELVYSNISVQEDFFRSQGFICDMITQ